jgi:hypothetical protein
MRRVIIALAVLVILAALTVQYVRQEGFTDMSGDTVYLDAYKDMLAKLYDNISNERGASSGAENPAEETSLEDDSGAKKPVNESKFLAEIEKTIRDEIKRARQTDSAVISPLESCQDTPSLKQGASYCPKCPDMSQYIRKDQIPCWNCTLA